MKKTTSFILVATLLVMGTGCTKFNENLNINPNLPSKASNAQLLTYAINQIPVYVESTTGILYVQQWAEKPYTDASRYLTVNFDFYGIYSNPLMNLKAILDTKEFNVNDGSKENQLAVARILRAWFYWHTTDRWGDVPYNDALLGRENFTPAYSPQKDIYYDLLKELKEAAAQINEDANPVKGDILFNGNMNLWKRFANSMRLLMALRLTKVDEAKGKPEFADAAAAELMEDNSESAVYIHLANAANQNYWYYVFNVQGRQWNWAS
ncbi:MAG TPA: SusD/RagB family nutrient-binding outer membrane lipoprotein, partial [Pseudobacter sp.]|nr:SusD/RagB family nutrient-binding outer membrane lipoprotein [Pseudobacter sp.]